LKPGTPTGKKNTIDPKERESREVSPMRQETHATQMIDGEWAQRGRDIYLSSVLQNL
jgi:hypothetical protein